MHKEFWDQKRPKKPRNLVPGQCYNGFDFEMEMSSFQRFQTNIFDTQP